MIDLHSHILCGLDDGAGSLDTSVEMARIAVADGITLMACTPHVTPGVYPNSSATILPAMDRLQGILGERGIPLALVQGADVHVDWNLPARLANREIPTLNGSRYFLLEPTQQVFVPRLEDLVQRLLKDGFIPIITHPERSRWIGSHYEVVRRLNAMGCPLQLTAGSLHGHFGQQARDFTVQMLDDDMDCIFASDAHGVRSRTPELSGAMRAVAERWGQEAADQMFLNSPAIILADENLPPPRAARGNRRARGRYRDTIGKLAGLLRAEH
ncbi:CpsB/CapC family capsule biosynthesis tyrosine phosphatase [uncultured Hoeflea sp.]|uniref:tyrosine-protein phosphatase n=1 Tax=uncultured Hoeflea sp. TaxID=538666 RepID=UPI0030DCC658|tara:strand:- start:507 stop:1316 length:810 start_codon:yes stop_codon:yes gene_type:complete